MATDKVYFDDYVYIDGRRSGRIVSLWSQHWLPLVWTVMVSLTFLTVTHNKIYQQHQGPLGRRQLSADMPGDMHVRAPLQLLNDEQRLRVDNVHSTCQKTPAKYQAQLRDLRNIYVDENNKTVYCAVPSAASTTLKFHLLKLSAGSDVPTDNLTRDHIHSFDFSRYGVHTLAEYSAAEVRSRVLTYHRYMFVRHPFERLYSAYKNMFTKTTAYAQNCQIKYGVPIIRKFRRRPSKESLLRGHDVTFLEFVKYIIHLYDTKSELNDNWKPINQLCLPCNIMYDFTGYLSTFSADAETLLETLYGVNPHDIALPRYQGREVNETVTAAIFAILPEKATAKLREIYHMDFQLFGFEYN